MPDYGQRKGGGAKGIGYFGEIQRPDGDISTELSIGVDGREIPSLVPTLSLKELAHLTGGGDMTKAIADKAAEHAEMRDRSGRSPFAADDEAVTVNYPMLRQGMQSRALRGR